MGWDVSKIKNPHLRKQLEELHGVKSLVAPAPVPAADPPPTPVRTVKRKPASEPLPKVLANVPLSTFTNSDTKMSTQLFLSVYTMPVGKPRMTQRDTWQKRPAVMRYRAFCDALRAGAGGHFPPGPDAIVVRAFLPMPDSWSYKKKAEKRGKGHRQKPDSDNILKAVCDGLLKEDSCLWSKHVQKYWCDPKDTRIEIRAVYRK